MLNTGINRINTGIKEINTLDIEKGIYEIAKMP